MTYRLCVTTLLLICMVLLPSPLWSQSARNLAQWNRIKQQLTGPTGEQFFESLKNLLLPDIEGTLISSRSIGDSDEFIIAIQDDITPEVTLRMKRHLKTPLPKGTPVDFEGVAIAFLAEPFMLTFAVEDVNRATQSSK